MYTPIPFYCYLPLCQALLKAHSFTRWMWNWKKTTPQNSFHQHPALPQVWALHFICVPRVVLIPSLLVLILPTYKGFRAGMCAPLLVLYLIKQPERLGGIITDSSGGLTCNRTALSHPTLFLNMYTSAQERAQWPRRRPLWRSPLHPRIINPPSDRQPEPERLDTEGQVIYGSM